MRRQSSPTARSPPQPPLPAAAAAAPAATSGRTTPIAPPSGRPRPPPASSAPADPAPMASVRVETSRRRKGQQRFRWTRENNDRQTGTVEWKKVTVFRWRNTVGPTIRARPLLFTERACPLCC